MPVSIHAPTRGATNSFCLASIFLRFQFTRPRGARRATQDFPAGCARFNSRAHEGRDRRRRQDRHAGGRFQFTRPRGARPSPSPRPPCGRPVSIHAPTRGATCLRRIHRRAMPVSIHAPTRGATRHQHPLRRDRRRFNSRAHEGRDAADNQGERDDGVSIHAPTRGATRQNQSKSAQVLFQFTRPRGARRPGRSPCRPRQSFQFTRPRGARLLPRIGYASFRGFNSRAHEGRDRYRAQMHGEIVVSIHAPTRGATSLPA